MKLKFSQVHKSGEKKYALNGLWKSFMVTYLGIIFVETVKVCLWILEMSIKLESQ